LEIENRTYEVSRKRLGFAQGVVKRYKNQQAAENFEAPEFL
jgi:hypothetical protein